MNMGVVSKFMDATSLLDIYFAYLYLITFVRVQHGTAIASNSASISDVKFVLSVSSCVKKFLKSKNTMSGNFKFD